MMRTLLQNLWVKGKNACLLLSRGQHSTFLLYTLLLLFLPTQLGKHFWPEYSLLSGFRVDYLSPTLYLTDMLVLLLFLQWSFVHRSRFTSLNVSAVLPYLLFLCFLLLTVLPA